MKNVEEPDGKSPYASADMLGIVLIAIFAMGTISCCVILYFCGLLPH